MRDPTAEEAGFFDREEEDFAGEARNCIAWAHTCRKIGESKALAASWLAHAQEHRRDLAWSLQQQRETN